jgi:hypothetical protein
MIYIIRDDSPSRALSDMAEVRICLPLTPPRVETLESRLRPVDYIQTSPVVKNLKRKLRFGSLGHIDAKRVKLDPSPNLSDKTIAQYQERIGDQLPEDRQTSFFNCPFTSQGSPS